MTGTNGEENTQTVAADQSVDSEATFRVMKHTVNGNHKALVSSISLWSQIHP